LVTEALVDAGVASGLTRSVATDLAVQTLAGSAAMLEYWLAFMRDGQPSGKKLPAWPAYMSNAPKTMVFGNNGIGVK
jgi:carboxylesterase type B